MNILTANKYPSARNGPLSHAEKETRRLCYAIKSTSSSLCDFHTAAAAMAPLITGPCWLVPIPSSTGNTDANMQLASMIARLVSTPAAPVQVVKAIARTRASPPNANATSTHWEPSNTRTTTLCEREDT